MTLDWQAFTPWQVLSGGLLIGLAAAIFILLNGRIAGISGILGGLLRAPQGDTGWRLAFVFGMMAAAWVWQGWAALPPMVIDADFAQLVVAGLLVGISTRYGSGCTSGHGVCGIARLSPRSLVATAAFMGSGFVTVYVIRHVVG
ncbi:MAG: YeeE/YedE family protein [Ketobacter sp.]|nr:MAG: YeeE/YedE family protein [Ketobacter sp.]